MRSILEPLRRHRGSLVAIGIGQALAMLGAAVGTRLLTEFASTATFGVAKLVLGLATLPMALLLRPFSQFTMREYHDALAAGRQRAFVRFARRGQLLLAVAVAVPFALVLALPQVGGEELSWLACLAAGAMVVGEALVTLERGLLVTMGRQVAASAQVALQQWAPPVAAVVALALLGDTAGNLVGAQAAAMLLLAAGALALDRSQPEPAPSWRAADAQPWIRESRRFVVPMLGVGVFGWVLSVGDRYLIAHWMTAGDVGRYAATYGLISTPMSMLATVTSRFLSPLYYRAAARDDVAHRRSMRTRTALGSLAIGAAATVGIAVGGDLVAALLLAEEYRAGVRPLLLWLTVGHGLLVVSFVYETDAFASKSTAVLTVAQGLAATIKVLASAMLIPRVGLLGAALGTCIAYAAYLAVLVLLIERRAARSTATGRSGA